ncbi:MAG: MBL fold metallo-hydrolase [Acidiferrobacterales bacterium]
MKWIILLKTLLVMFGMLVVSGFNIVHAGQSKSQLDSPPVVKKYGTDPTRYFLPKTAIDTTEVPNIALKSSDKESDPLPYFKITTGTYLFFGNIAQIDKYNRGWNGNAGFVVTSEGVVVIDSLGTPRLGRRMISTIRSITDKPIKYLIITHNHPDHSYGAIAFRDLGGVKVVSHAGALDYINSNKIDNSVDYRRSIIKEDMAGFAAVAPDIPIAGKRFSSYKLSVGDKTFEIYNTGQHHSFGDLVVFQTDEKIVWISDLAFNQRTTFMGDGNTRQAITAQDWLLAKFPDAKLMIPGHGSAQTPPFPMVRKTQDYMKRLRSTLNRAMDDGLDLLEAVDQADFKDWRNIRLYGLNQRANANFVYRELEQENF